MLDRKRGRQHAALRFSLKQHCTTVWVMHSFSATVGFEKKSPSSTAKHLPVTAELRSPANWGEAHTSIHTDETLLRTSVLPSGFSELHSRIAQAPVMWWKLSITRVERTRALLWQSKRSCLYDPSASECTGLNNSSSVAHQGDARSRHNLMLAALWSKTMIT